MADAARGETEVRLGGTTLLLRFRTAEAVDLEDRLDSDVLAFILQRKGTTKFLLSALVAGTAHMDKGRPSPKKIAKWLDDYEGDVGDLLKEVTYAIARGRPLQEAKAMLQILDEVFSGTPRGEQGPLGLGSPGTSTETT